MKFWQVIIITMLSGLPPTIAATAALVLALRNHRAVKEVHLALNSRLDEFVKIAQAASFAAGVKSETDKR